VGWVERLHDKIVGLDTAPLIYFIEDDPRFAGHLSEFFEAVELGQIRIATSVVTLLEVLVRPFREQQVDLAKRYREILLSSTGFDTLAVSAEIAEQAAQLRATHGLRTPDAIQLATAITAGATAFLTNDARLAKVAPLEVLVMADLDSA
jgi:predicted nucleic acid-binding protein